MRNKIKELINKEYRKKSKELVNYIFKSYFSSVGLEFDSLTENDLKNSKFIHWPSLAKRNEIIYKKFQEEKTINIILAIDEIIFFNKYYYWAFINFKEELLKELPPIIKKYIIFLSSGKKINLRNNNALKKYIEKYETKDLGKIKISSLIKEKNAFIIFLSDFLNYDLNELKKKISNNSFFVFLVPKYSFYYPLEFLHVYRVRKKIIKKFENFQYKNKFIL